MSDNILVLVLGEVIFILLILCIFLLLITIKQRKNLHTLNEQYKELRKRTRHVMNEIEYGEINALPEPVRNDPVGIFLHSTSQYSIERYKKFMPAGIPSLSAESPYGAKVAALRYLYLMAEAENRAKQNSPENWLLLEKKLADIVRWVRNMPKPTNATGGRIKQLHEKIDSLKKYEMENSHIKRQLAYAREKNQSLTNTNKQQKDNLRKMQTVIDAFQRSLPEDHTTAYQEKSFTGNETTTPKHYERVYNTYQGSMFQVASIVDISKKKQQLLHSLSTNLKNSFTNVTSDAKHNFEVKIKELEQDIVSSDSHIVSLQKELRQARNSIDQLKEPQELAAGLSPTPSQDLSQESSLQPTETTEQTFDLITDQTTSNDQPGLNQSWLNEGGHARTLEEIEKLRNNNQNQRKIILELNSEISSLRDSINTTDDEQLKTEKNNEIVKLERLVKECEYCIETLESEVDLLRDQMTDENPDEHHPDIQRLNQDIELMASKLHQSISKYSHSSIINLFSLKLLECASIETIAQLLTESLRSFNISYGFYLDSEAEKIEYHSDGTSTVQEQRSLKAAENANTIGYTNDGILFFRRHARIIAKNPPEDDQEQALLEASLNTLCQLVNSRINHMVSLDKISRHDHTLNNSISQIKESLIKITEKHHAQSKDIKNIVNDLTKEIEGSVKLMNPSAAVKSVFDNAISECYQRLDVILSDSISIDRHATDIINSLQPVANVQAVKKP